MNTTIQITRNDVVNDAQNIELP